MTSSVSSPLPVIPMRGSKKKRPVVCLVLGMAGSGKTTLLQRINMELHTKYSHHRPASTLDDIDGNADDNEGSRDESYFLMNLDPAVKNTGFEANVDIRDTVNFKQVMEHFKLGPNGAILTSLNLFATRFDQVIHIIQRKVGSDRTVDGAAQETPSASAPPSTSTTAPASAEKEGSKTDTGKEDDDFWIFVDTPGQIEIFSWSASGQVISEMLSSEWATVIVFLLDSVRSSQNPVAFMSNLLYAVSIFYKFHLPFIIAFTKNDVGHNFDMLRGWMEDFEMFRTALRESSHGGNYSANLAESLALVLDEFYKHIPCVAVSAVTGEGMDTLFDKIHEARKQYDEEFRPALEEKIRVRREKETHRREREMERLQTDLDKSQGGRVFFKTAPSSSSSSSRSSDAVPPQPQLQQPQQQQQQSRATRSLRRQIVQLDDEE